ncbi:unnamed protein product [Darwinula stevensoni]|uniref:ABC transporter domain-containing protein n=1 Tax=Darwinula stevensoni TaxID=69355 RepID=A0A7R9A9Z3_9CRUS|nr:unnamed protein product [Darwinula stevensoni]CAG0897823.1 unnamed protein product [Darwinula stevensoni]
MKKPPGGRSHLPVTNPLEITYSGLHYCVRDGRRGMKEILKGLDGRMKPGELTAIMGPSGAGKTCLMNVLAGYRVKGVTGSVEVNGRERDLRVFRHLSTYIPQQDQTIPTLTVMESMLVAASLKLPSSVSFEDKLAAVEEILEHLGIQHCAKTKAGHLSGGERKRLCIAMELVSNPPVLFLDEPTNALDSSTCLQCVSLLRMLAHEGRSVICTIHHPSAKILEMFDHLIILTEGQCLYHGTISSMVTYLRQFGLHCPPYHNPADFVMDVAVGDNGREAMNTLFAAAKAEATTPSKREGPDPQVPLCLEGKPPPSTTVSGLWNRLNNSARRAETKPRSTPPCTQYPVSFAVQVKYLFMRFYKINTRDWMLLHIRLGAHVLVALFLGFLFSGLGDNATNVHGNVGTLYFSVLFVVCGSMMPTVVTYPLEFPVLRKETLNKWYSLKAYHMAKTLSDIPFAAFCTSVYLTITYFMTAQPMDADRFFRYLALGVYVALISQTLGFMFGTIFPIQTAAFLSPVAIIMFILFSGFLLSVKSIPGYLRWLSHLSFLKYYFEGTMSCIYGNNRPDLQCDKPYCHFKDPDKFLRELTIDDFVYWKDFWVLLLFVVILRLLAYFVLRWKLHRAR